MYTLKYQRVTPFMIFSSMNIDLFNTDIDHLMDNIVLRGTSGNGVMKWPTASDTYGGRIIGAIGSDMRAGIDYEHNRKDAEQNMVMSGSNKFLAYLWPGVETEKLGIFFEKDLGNISYGLRYDQVELDPTKSTEKGGMMSKTPNEVYSTDYAGTIVATKREYDNISGFLRFTRDITHGETYINLSVNERAPDTTELFHAKWNASSAMMRHVGNPCLLYTSDAADE